MIAAHGHSDDGSREIARGLATAVQAAVDSMREPPSDARTLSWNAAVDVAELLDLEGLVLLLAACESHQGAPPLAVAHVLERITRLSQESVARGDSCRPPRSRAVARPAGSGLTLPCPIRHASCVNCSLVRLGRLLALALVLVAGSFAPGGLFVCLGLDGHIAVESTAGGCEDERSAPGAGADTRCTEDDCGSCLDLGLDRSAPARSTLAGDPDAPLDPVVLPYGVELDPARAIVLHAPGSAPPSERRFAATRSTILRC